MPTAVEAAGLGFLTPNATANNMSEAQLPGRHPCPVASPLSLEAKMPADACWLLHTLFPDPLQKAWTLQSTRAKASSCGKCRSKALLRLSRQQHDELLHKSIPGAWHHAITPISLHEGSS